MASRTLAGAVPPKLVQLATDASTVSTSYTSVDPGLNRLEFRERQFGQLHALNSACFTSEPAA